MEPFTFLNVDDFVGSKIVWPVPWDLVEAGSSVDQTYFNSQLVFSQKRQEDSTYPQIRRSGIKVKIESLWWGTDLNWAKVLGIVLLVLCCDLASLTSGVSSSCSSRPFRENSVGCGLAANLVKQAVMARL